MRVRWVRFHSLPESKRYPDTEAEYRTLLDRHNRILEELVGAHREVVMLTTEYSSIPDAVGRAPELQDVDRGARLWRTVPMHELEGDPDPNYWHVYASEVNWTPGALDPLIRLVADDAVSNVMIVARDCRWLVHPYDGGMDVILDSHDERNRLRSAHADWLSARQDGL